MGRNKSALRLGRHTLLAHVRAGARNSGFPHRVIRRDLVPRCGPLGGVYTALTTTRADVLVFLPCDMPFISADLVKFLVARLGHRKNGLFVEQNGRVGFPFLVRRAALPVVEQLLSVRQLSLQKLARALSAQIVRLPRHAGNCLFNINTPEDWTRAKARWRRAAER